MTKIQDMSRTQRQSWLVLLADGAVFFWLWQKMTTGLSPVPIAYDMNEFGKIILSAVALTVVLHVIISTIFELSAKDEKGGRDERDDLIERRGAFWGYRILQTGIGIVVVGMFLAAISGEGVPNFYTISTPVQIIFALMVTSYVADLVKHGVMIHGYGR